MTDPRTDPRTDPTTDEERVLRDLLGLAVDTLAAPTARLEHHARAAGARRRRRGRAGAAAAGVTAAAAAVAAVLLTGPADPGRAVDPATSTTAPEVRVGTASAAFPGSLPPVDVSARQVLRALRPLLPGDADTSQPRLRYTDAAPGESGEVRSGVVVVVDRHDDTRRGSVEVRLNDAPERPLPADDPDVVEAMTCPVAGYDPPPTTCTVLRDGDRPVGRALESRTDGFLIREVLLQTPAGRWVHVADANSVDEKWGRGYDALPGDPPLSLDELAAVARSSTWDDLGPP